MAMKMMGEKARVVDSSPSTRSPRLLTYGVRSLITVTFFAAKSMLNDVTHSSINLATVICEEAYTHMYHECVFVRINLCALI